jgi:hypothetical protein
VSGVFPRVPTEGPITFALLQTPDIPVPKPPPRRRTAPPFREWLPWAVPFVGGIAFHQFNIVPTYAASHGCVRRPVAVARMTYDFAEIGMPVRVIARS